METSKQKCIVWCYLSSPFSCAGQIDFANVYGKVSFDLFHLRTHPLFHSRRRNVCHLPAGTGLVESYVPSFWIIFPFCAENIFLHKSLGQGSSHLTLLDHPLVWIQHQYCFVIHFDSPAHLLAQA